MISIIHPSRGRPYQARVTYEQWANNADGEFEYLLSLDQDDETKEEYYQLFLNKTKNGVCCLHKNRSAIEAINKAAKNAKGDLFIVISDDFSCPEHWDTLLLKELEGKSDFLVKTQDGIQKTLITLPIMDRKYYERFNYIYEPGYVHMYSDTEMTVVGHMLGRVINSNLLFTHNHYTTGKSSKDAVNEKNDKSYPQGESHFAKRLLTNFGIDKPLVHFDQIVWH